MKLRRNSSWTLHRLSCWVLIIVVVVPSTSSHGQSSSRNAIHPRLDFTKRYPRTTNVQGYLGDALRMGNVHTWEGFRKTSEDPSPHNGEQAGNNNHHDHDDRQSSLRTESPKERVKGRRLHKKSSKKAKGKDNDHRPGPPPPKRPPPKRPPPKSPPPKRPPPKRPPPKRPSHTSSTSDVDGGDDDHDDDNSTGPMDCFSAISLVFLQFPAINNPDDPVNPVFVDSNNPDEQDLGTVYIYNDALLNENIAELEESFATGHCTRTQMRIPVGDVNFVSGGGYCHFTYTLFDGASSYTFNAAGEVFDSFGGVLPVIGGTGDGGFVGVTGVVEVLPFTVTSEGEFVPSDEDVFMGPEIYRVEATLYRNTCLAGVSTRV